MFITLEGGEGCGKTTLQDALSEALQQEGHEVVCTREPGGSPLGQNIRKWLLDDSEPISSEAELLLFLADRAQHVAGVIRPALERGEWVICDRFSDSTVAYQGHARGFGAERVEKLCEFASGGLQPDLTFYLDLDPHVGFERIASRSGELDRLEKEEGDFHRKVREGFLEQARRHPERVIVVDATQSPQEVLAEVMSHLNAFAH